ncbi:MAG: 2-succinylbenzoate--CoA ligase [Actinomycetota bacterium]|jgi:O-succinylbenzoic acid--CoA ligase
MARLIALDMPASKTFVDLVQRAWSNGDAVLPIDQRLPLVSKKLLMDKLAPSEIIDASFTTSSLPNGRPMQDGDALVIASSGSTGSPKGIIHTHSSIIAGAKASASRLQLSSSDHWLVCIPVSHVGGFSVVARALHTGAVLTLHPAFDVAAVQEAAKNGATHTSLVATALSRIDTSLFKSILLGGSSAPANLPSNVITTYGMTETGGGVVYNGQPLDNVEIKIVDGEILLRCPMLMRAFRDDQVNPLEDGWYATGDIGEILDDGKLSVHGRQTDLIITGGENVWPSVVENSLASHPIVNQVVVRGMPDTTWGQRVVAYVVLNDSRQTSEVKLLSDLREHVKQTLPAFCAPQQIVVLTEIPRTSLGKVDVQALPSLNS